MKIQYLEIVTKEVDAVCAAYASALKVKFGEPDAGVGNARTATLAGGGLVGVRAALREPLVQGGYGVLVERRSSCATADATATLSGAVCVLVEAGRRRASMGRGRASMNEPNPSFAPTAPGVPVSAAQLKRYAFIGISV